MRARDDWQTYRVSHAGAQQWEAPPSIYGAELIFKGVIDASVTDPVTSCVGGRRSRYGWGSSDVWLDRTNDGGSTWSLVSHTGLYGAAATPAALPYGCDKTMDFTSARTGWAARSGTTWWAIVDSNLALRGRKMHCLSQMLLEADQDHRRPFTLR